MKPPLKMKAALTSRVKILSQLNIAERRVPQDGRLKLKMGTRVIDFRVSTLPVLFGEKIVLRILDKGNLTLDLTKFGFEPKAEADLMRAILNPYGMVLVTGPTGSGKTTTLYSALQRINTVETNIMTAEDPVEYNLPGINQVAGAAGGRADVRGGAAGVPAPGPEHHHDRRDPRPGDRRASRSRRRSPATWCCRRCTPTTRRARSIRLIDMGIEAFNVASAVNLVVAQRLVRRICTECKAPVTYTDAELRALSDEPRAAAADRLFPAGTGCDSVAAPATGGGPACTRSWR